MTLSHIRTSWELINFYFPTNWKSKNSFISIKLQNLHVPTSIQVENSHFSFSVKVENLQVPNSVQVENLQVPYSVQVEKLQVLHSVQVENNLRIYILFIIENLHVPTSLHVKYYQIVYHYNLRTSWEIMHKSTELTSSCFSTGDTAVLRHEMGVHSLGWDYLLHLTRLLSLTCCPSIHTKPNVISLSRELPPFKEINNFMWNKTKLIFDFQLLYINIIHCKNLCKLAIMTFPFDAW